MLQFAKTVVATLALLSTLVHSTPIARSFTHNDYSCRSKLHPNPVVLIHGLGATYYEDLNFLEAHLQTQGFCTFSITYGAYPVFPLVGGLKPIKESSAQLAAFIQTVLDRTGAGKVDLVGHSEGAFLSLYVPKFGGLGKVFGRVFAIAPPTHGTTFLNLYELTGIDGGILTRPLVDTILDTVGCKACANLLPNGDAVARLNDGPIAQEGVSYTILTSRYDELVTPTETSFVREDGVRNLYVQDFCPLDPVGHIGEAYDLNIWALVVKSLQDDESGPEICVAGSPGR